MVLKKFADNNSIPPSIKYRWGIYYIHEQTS